MHFDKVIDGKDREREPHRGCRRRSDLQNHHTDDSGREQDLEVDDVTGRNLDLAVQLLAEVHKCPGTVRSPGQILRFLLKLVRKVVDLGVLTLNKVVPNSPEAEKKLLFLPTSLTAGIELSDDPLPSVRAAAYAVSFGRRSQ